jgi:hypothetical protein
MEPKKCCLQSILRRRGSENRYYRNLGTKIYIKNMQVSDDKLQGIRLALRTKTSNIFTVGQARAKLHKLLKMAAIGDHVVIVNKKSAQKFEITLWQAEQRTASRPTSPDQRHFRAYRDLHHTFHVPQHSYYRRNREHLTEYAKQ